MENTSEQTEKGITVPTRSSFPESVARGAPNLTQVSPAPKVEMPTEFPELAREGREGNRVVYEPSAAARERIPEQITAAAIAEASLKYLPDRG